MKIIRTQKIYRYRFYILNCIHKKHIKKSYEKSLEVFRNLRRQSLFLLKTLKRVKTSSGFHETKCTTAHKIFFLISYLFFQFYFCDYNISFEFCWIYLLFSILCNKNLPLWSILLFLASNKWNGLDFSDDWTTESINEVSFLLNNRELFSLL